MQQDESELGFRCNIGIGARMGQKNLIQLEAALNLLWHHHRTQGQKQREKNVQHRLSPYQVSGVSFKWYSSLTTIKQRPQPQLHSPVTPHLCEPAHYLKETDLLRNQRSVLHVDKQVPKQVSHTSVQIMARIEIWTR